VSRKFRRKILGCAKLLIGCHSIPLRSDHDHDLVALFSTHRIECGCLLFLVDVELYDPSCNINCGFGGTQEWTSKNEWYLMTDIHFKYHKVYRHERIPDSHRDIFRRMQGSRDQGIMIQLIVDYLWYDTYACSVISESLIRLLSINQIRDG
jgi:hypothetical protein